MSLLDRIRQFLSARGVLVKNVIRGVSGENQGNQHNHEEEVAAE
ncbi:MAG TPA: hypothetical protein VF311_09885 [Terriglobales bacterium]